MEETIEKVVKLILVLILVLAGLLYWLLPKTRLAKYLKMNEALFVITNIIGMIFGVLGLGVTFVWPRFIVELHLWELIVTPFVLVYVYWALIMRIRKTSEIVDEKQDYNMTKAGAVTMAFSIPAMAFMFILYYNEIFDGPIWFPYYFFVTILIFSCSTLFYFKKA